MTEQSFRDADVYSGLLGFRGAFPNFHEGVAVDHVVCGTYFLQAAAPTVWRTILASDLGLPHTHSVPERFRKVNDWAAANGYAAGFPNFQQGGAGDQLAYGVVLFPPSPDIAFRNITAADLGNPGSDDVPERFRKVDDWAGANNYAAGFPNFHEALAGNDVVFGTILFTANYPIEWQNVSADVLGMHRRFHFYDNITDAEKDVLLERHAFAYNAVTGCGNLNATQKADARKAYRKDIVHGITEWPVMALTTSYVLGGPVIRVNRANFFGAVSDEKAQSLLHEVMHIAGYSHPERRDPAEGDPKVVGIHDIPGDNGPYYGTVPLQAEICIAGAQSDAPDDTVTGVQIHHIVNDPVGPELDGEHVLLENLAATDVDMTAWTLEDAVGHTFHFPVFTLGAGATLKVWTRVGADDADELFWGSKQPIWNNRGGDTAILRNSAQEEISRFTYV